MNEEQLREVKEEKDKCFMEVARLRKEEAKILQSLYKIQEEAYKMKRAYESLDRRIALEEKLTVCPPAGDKKLKVKRTVGISGLTKEEALKIIQGLPD